MTFLDFMQQAFISPAQDVISAKLNKTKVKKHEDGNKVSFDGNLYVGSAYINTSGDTIREYIPETPVRPGKLYQIRYTNKKDGNGLGYLTTREESGELVPGKEYVMNQTSQWGKQINDSFKEPAYNLPITENYSLKPWYFKWLYKLGGL